MGNTCPRLLNLCFDIRGHSSSSLRFRGAYKYIDWIFYSLLHGWPCLCLSYIIGLFLLPRKKIFSEDLVLGKRCHLCNISCLCWCRSSLPGFYVHICNVHLGWVSKKCGSSMKNRFLERKITTNLLYMNTWLFYDKNRYYTWS